MAGDDRISLGWKDIPATFKLSAAIVVACLGIIGYLTTYQSDAEAQAYQQQHASELAQVRIQMLEQKIQEYRYQLLSTKLNPEQRQWIMKELQRLEDQVKCIREGKC